jgi:tellurite methyltransferase
LLPEVLNPHQSAEFNIEPSAFLVENVESLPCGRVLDVAMGAGRNAVYLAERGFEVEGVDISSDAIQAALKLAASRRVQIKTNLADLQNGFLIEVESYAVIMVFNYLQRGLFPQIKNGLQKNGVAICETFIIDQLQFGHPHNPDHLLRHNELLEYFRDFRVLRYQEGIFNHAVAKASIIAQKLV